MWASGVIHSSKDIYEEGAWFVLWTCWDILPPVGLGSKTTERSSLDKITLPGTAKSELHALVNYINLSLRVTLR